MALCACGHEYDEHIHRLEQQRHTACACSICGCMGYTPRHDPRYDPDDVGDQGYSDEGHPYSGLGKVRR